MYKRRYSKARYAAARGIAIAALTLFAVIGMVSLVVHVNAERAAAYEYHNEGVCIVDKHNGTGTLWQIAGLHSDNRHDVRKVIDIIYDLNPGLTAIIHDGDVITVPLFECMDWSYWEE